MFVIEAGGRLADTIGGLRTEQVEARLKDPSHDPVQVEDEMPHPDPGVASGTPRARVDLTLGFRVSLAPGNNPLVNQILEILVVVTEDDFVR